VINLAKEIEMKQITISVSDFQYSMLSEAAIKLGLKVEELMQSVVPSFPTVDQEATVVKVEQLQSTPTSPTKMCDGIDAEALTQLLGKLKETGTAKTLLKELEDQLPDSNTFRDYLTWTTESRLRRWANPARIDDRTKVATPICRKICELIYGFVPGRAQ
jgi:hypothetical protein